MKQKLMKALNSLPMTIKDKEDFVNTIVDNCNKGGGGAAVSEYAPRYFKIDWDKASEDWKIIVRGYTSNDHTYYTTCIANLIKLKIPYEDKNINLVITPMVSSNEMSQFIDYLIAFSYQPVLSLNEELTEGVNIMTFEENIEMINSNLGWKYNLTMEGIIEITEEEFYKID